MFEQVAQAERAGRMTSDDRDARQAKMHHRCRFGSHLPLHASPRDLRVNCIECWETTADGPGQHVSWITAVRVNTGTGYQRMRGARARWRIANATFNTLKNQGYHCEHNFGHGYHHLSVVLATLRRLAFVVDHIQQLCGPRCQAAWAQGGSKRLLWAKMRAYFSLYALEAMRPLCAALCDDLHKPTPTLASEACSCASPLRACLPSCTLCVAELYPKGTPTLQGMAPRFASRFAGSVTHGFWEPKEAPGEPSGLGRIGSLGQGGNC